jgi:NAD(P)-dependent dehydrogenase (short-subunit alcohol dehydrogenase family)
MCLSIMPGGRCDERHVPELEDTLLSCQMPLHRMLSCQTALHRMLSYIAVLRRLLQGKVISDIREVDRERLEHTYRLNVFAPFALTQVHTPALLLGPAKPWACSRPGTSITWVPSTCLQASLAHMAPGSSILNVASDEAYGPQFMVMLCDM